MSRIPSIPKSLAVAAALIASPFLLPSLQSKSPDTTQSESQEPEKVFVSVRDLKSVR